MRKPIQYRVSLLLLVLLSAIPCNNNYHPHVLVGASSLDDVPNENQPEQERPKDRRFRTHTNAASRVLQQRRRFVGSDSSSKSSKSGGKGRGGGGSGRGGGGSSYLRERYGIADSFDLRGRGFLPPRFDPMPFVNCIPLPDYAFGRVGKAKAKAKGRSGLDGVLGGSSKGGGGKGKGGKGKGRNRRAHRLHMGRDTSRRALHLRGRPNRGPQFANQVARTRKMTALLPWCPPGFEETIIPTSLPSFTPIPTYTPLPSITPYPSFTPFPTIEATNDGPTQSPSLAPSSTPPVPTVSSAPSSSPTLSNAPSLSSMPSRGGLLITIYADFAIRYFSGQAGDVDRDLTADERAELITLMDEFYTTAFQTDAAFSGSFQSYMTEETNYVYTAGGDPNIAFDFNANYQFASGSGITANQVLLKMEGLDYQAFITDYLFRNPPQNQLDNVQAVAFTGGVNPPTPI